MPPRMGILDFQRSLEVKCPRQALNQTKRITECPVGTRYGMKCALLNLKSKHIHKGARGKNNTPWMGKTDWGVESV